jgi:hypothetical protein
MEVPLKTVNEVYDSQPYRIGNYLKKDHAVRALKKEGRCNEKK